MCVCLQITIIQGVLSDINMKKGESESQYYIDKLEYLDDRQRDPRIDQCKSLLCHGELRNKSGTVSLEHTHEYAHIIMLKYTHSHPNTPKAMILSWLLLTLVHKLELPTPK